MIGQDDREIAASGGLSLQVLPETRRLVAQFVPGPMPPDAARLKETLGNAGYGDWRLLEPGFIDFVRALPAAEAPVSAEIAEQRDAELELMVSADELEARLTLLPAYGGKPATRAEVEALLAAKKVTEGVDWPAIEAALARGQADALPVARGSAAERGRDARFVSLLKPSRGRRPKINEAGVADYRDLDAFLVVAPGDALMRRVPATPGRNGRNVHGQVVAAQAGNDQPFVSPPKGTRSAENDPNLLLADIAGVPTVLPDGVWVEPVITVKNIDLSTGNLEFDGVVNIEGDVTAGLRVKASGDIFIAGTVEGAEILSEGNIEIRGGILGQAGSQQLPANPARIRCAGNLIARFVIHARVEAGDSVIVRNEIAHSEITAHREVRVGDKGSPKAQIIGGSVRALTLVRAPVLGSSGGLATRLLVGHDPEAALRMQALRDDATRKEELRDEAIKGIQYLIRRGEGESSRVLKLREAIQQLMTQLRENEAAQAELHEQLGTAAEARIVATRAVYSGLELTIGHAEELIREDCGPRTFGCREGKVVAL